MRRIMPGLSSALLEKTAKIRDGLTLLVVMLLPFQTRFIQSYGFLGDAPWEPATRGIFATELLLLSALLFHFLAVAHDKKKERKAPSWLRFWLLLLLFALASILWSPHQGAASIAWTHLFEGFALAYLIWISKTSLRHYAYAFVGGGVVNASFGVWQFLTQTSFPSTVLGMAQHSAGNPGVSVIEVDGGRFLRAYGLSPHPNILGGHLVVTLLTAVWLYIDNAKRWVRPALLGAISLMTLGLAFSFSRSAWLAYGFILLVSLSYRFGRKTKDEKIRLTKILILHIVLSVFVFVIAGPLITTRLGMGSRLERISIDERGLASYHATELLKTHYAAGVGIGNMPLAAYEELQPQGNAYSYQPVHHVGLLVAVELGFFGFMMLLGAITLWLVEAKRIFRTSTNILVRGVVLLPLAFIVIGFFDHYPLSLYAGTMLVGTVFGFFLKVESES